LESLVKIAKDPWVQGVPNACDDDTHGGLKVVGQAVVYPHPLATFVYYPRMIQIAQVTGRLRLRDLERVLEVAHTEFSMLGQQSQHVQAGLIGQGLEPPG